MRPVDELILPDDVGYTENHEWARKDGSAMVAGITDYAQEELGDIVYVELPEIGQSFEKGAEFGTVESVKAVAELYMPVAGEIAGTNPELENRPDLVNEDPYGRGWLVMIRPADPGEMQSLMDKATYYNLLKGL
ncbi:glycine cleavage system H protein [Desulfosalsimonas propionicica]|uniref:Glycine cleavage system H protein n=1 Tax=Desulfosalsimonas propionicica TaxID=332175 RepID=A0A7W0HLM3_9BACT|nr:glycine cleavage system protein GcvH [Desulfosalsimonas propionicica]MBA2882484.1 glycine cleavage system H protein [Desulfosalsimonas propionicica]